MSRRKTGNAANSDPEALARVAEQACARLVAILELSLKYEAKARARLSEHEDVWVPTTRFALSQVVMRLHPALVPGWIHTDPVHVVMFGGTNSGKSTVLNVLLGRPAAGMSFRARFSQHPEAFRISAVGNRFLDAFPTRFAGYARYVDAHPPRQEDEHLREQGYKPALAVNDPKRMGGPALATPATVRPVVWDIPDFSTEEAQEYLYPALFDTVAMADLVVMVVTRENYADHRGGLLRALLCEAGLPITVVANKLEPGSDLIDDIRRKVGGTTVDTAPINPSRILPLSQVNAESETDRLRILLETPEAAAIRDALAIEVADGAQLKRRALQGMLQFLDRKLDEALAPLRDELETFQYWDELVQGLARVKFFEAYDRDYLHGKDYVDFNQTMVKLMDKLEAPYVGWIISGASKKLKSVSRHVFSGVSRGVKQVFGSGSSDPPRSGPELEIVGKAFDDWFTTLRGETQALAQNDPNPAWREIAVGLDRLLANPEYVDGLVDSYHEFRDSMDRITRERALVIYEKIAENPMRLYFLRVAKVTLDVGMTALIVKSGGIDWTDAVIAPLIAPIQNLFVEWGLGNWIKGQKNQLKQEQFQALRVLIQARMIDPVRGLFRPAATADEVFGARRDLATISTALQAVLSERSERGS